MTILGHHEAWIVNMLKHVSLSPGIIESVEECTECNNHDFDNKVEFSNTV